MLQLGAHVSISDGFGSAVQQQVDLSGNVGQIFVGSPRGWKVKEITNGDHDEFVDAISTHEMGPWIVHGTYLINFATPKDDLARKSIETVQAELNACDALSIPYYVFHPGAHTGAGVDTGIENVAQRLSEVEIPSDVTLLLENTAGKGTTIGKTFEELNRMVAESTHSYGDLGICLDTCHLHAAGYDFSTSESLDALIEELDTEVGLENVKYLHLNDSKHALGAVKDGHEHIGDAEIRDEGYRTFITDPVFRDRPMVLETPEGDEGYSWNSWKIRCLVDQ